MWNNMEQNEAVVELNDDCVWYDLTTAVGSKDIITYLTIIKCFITCLCDGWGKTQS